MEITKSAVAGEVHAVAGERVLEALVEADEVVVIYAVGPVIIKGSLLGGIESRVHVQLGHAGRERLDRGFDAGPAADPIRVDETIGEDHAFRGGERTERKANGAFGGGT